MSNMKQACPSLFIVPQKHPCHCHLSLFVCVVSVCCQIDAALFICCCFSLFRRCFLEFAAVGSSDFPPERSQQRSNTNSNFQTKLINNPLLQEASASLFHLIGQAANTLEKVNSTLLQLESHLYRLVEAFKKGERQTCEDFGCFSFALTFQIIFIVIFIIPIYNKI